MRTILRDVVPRTRESSTITTRFPSITLRTGASLSFTPKWRIAARLDERATDVVRADQPHLVRDAALLGKTERAGTAAVGHRDHDVGFARLLAREDPPELRRARRTGAPEHDRVGPREVDVLEHAERPGGRGNGLERRSPSRSRYDLAGLDLADELALDQIECAGLAGDEPRGVLDPPSTSGRKPFGSRTPIERVWSAEQAVRPLTFEGGDESRLHIRFARQQVKDDLGVSRGLEDRSLRLELDAELLGVHQVPVVGDRDLTARILEHERLGVAELGASRGGVAGVSDRARPRQALQGRGAEDVGHVAHPALDVEALAVPRHDARALLAAVLQRIETQRVRFDASLEPSMPKMPHI